MSRLASASGPPRDRDEHDRGALLASVIAVLFAVIAVISFAVDQSVTLGQ